MRRRRTCNQKHGKTCKYIQKQQSKHMHAHGKAHVEKTGPTTHHAAPPLHPADARGTAGTVRGLSYDLLANTPHFHTLNPLITGTLQARRLQGGRLLQLPARRRRHRQGGKAPEQRRHGD